MAAEHTELECGCEIIVYGDGSARPEVMYCESHDKNASIVGTLARYQNKLGMARACLRAAIDAVEGEPSLAVIMKDTLADWKKALTWDGKEG